jgi:SET domain-containing protein
MERRLYIKSTRGKGRGVFCNRPILKDEIIEECPLLIIPAQDYDELKATLLIDYFFSFNEAENAHALALGFGSLYNHARLSNADYSINKETKTMTCFAIEFIDKGKEICINYAGKQGEDFKEWFTTRNIECCY